ncbi:unnamed protein product [Symbiodinium sp. CCMP2592]|nr:unnamed protein product [Symbiodinium sp. CCMP2592]
MCEDEFGTVLPLDETPVPRPVFMGPWFEDVDSPLHSGASGVEVLQLQKALTRLGYLAEDPNFASGVFDETTAEAVKEFQRFSGLTQDGIVGPVTKAQLTAQRFDKMPDVNLGGSPFKDGKLTYAVGLLPGYLERYRADCLREMHEALAQWCTALGMELKRTSHLQARLHIVFQPLAMAGAEPEPGGALAEATANRIVLDSSERWLLKAQTKPDRFQKAFYLSPVLLHEVGHSLGLKHSSDPADVMWPYYRPEPNLVLSMADCNALTALFRPSNDCCTLS